MPMFKVPTMLWGEVEVRYFRTHEGVEGLRVPACKVTAAQWSENPIGPPPILTQGDITTTTEWASYVRRAKHADVAAAKAAEDAKFAYKPPHVATEPEESQMKKQTKVQPKEKSTKGKAPVKPDFKLEPIPPAPPPLSPGSAQWADPSTLQGGGPRPISAPRGR